MVIKRWYTKKTRPVVRWRPTKALEEYGRPIAAFALKHSVDSGRSINAVLGTKESPQSRLRILEMVREGVCEESDLIEDLQLASKNVLEHMRALREEGLIGFETGTSEDGRGWAEYRWKDGKKPGDAMPVNRRLPALTREIAKLLHRRGGYMMVGDIRKAAGNKHPPDVSTVLTGLYDQGMVEMGRWSNSHRSEVWLEDGGGAFMSEWSDMVYDALSDGPALRAMRRALRKFERDPGLREDYASRGVGLYERSSNIVGRKTKDEREAEITIFIRKYQNMHGYGPRHIEIERAIGVGVCSYLSAMEGDTLSKTRSGKAVRYQLIATESDSPLMARNADRLSCAN
jgi:DNA-binding transcriptional ArsR family regulator